MTIAELTIAEIRAAKEDLEMGISQSVRSLVDEFRDRTGLAPSRIDIPMIEVTTFASAREEYDVGSARVEIRL